MSDASRSRTVALADLPDRVPTLVGLLVALVGQAAIGLALYPRTADATGLANGFYWLGPHWIAAGALLVLVLFWERRSLRSIGIGRPEAVDVGLGLVGFVVGIGVFVATAPMLSALGLSTGGENALLAQPTWVVFGMAVTAGVTEEVLFRGYPIERLAELSGSVWLGAGLSLAVFAVLHVPLWGVGTTIQIALWSLIPTVLYVRRRSLAAPVLMHILNDVFGFVVVPMLG